MIELLKNPSVSAFVGAFSAFMLVVVADWFRRGNDKNLLSCLISDTADHARKKIESVQINLNDLNNNGRLSKAAFMPFKTSHIDHVLLKVLTRLSANEKQAADAIVYWAEATDNQLDELAETAWSAIQQLKETGKGPEVEAILSEYRSEAKLAIRNMEIIIQYCESYVSGRPHEVVESYNVSE
ncbi:hypothetical protein [Shewanella spartinae]|uniref:hypothetical protein n=1 Tax=Shewanella spartinae TaxID=2864205 RepID=UPI001C65A297|nr:hypothetical protein [Shewanella spartinae]QYJ95038.1 hypothetical protein K0I31_06550 [Shewanella spartinae]